MWWLWFKGEFRGGRKLICSGECQIYDVDICVYVGKCNIARIEVKVRRTEPGRCSLLQLEDSSVLSQHGYLMSRDHQWGPFLFTSPIRIPLVLHLWRSGRKKRPIKGNATLTWRINQGFYFCLFSFLLTSLYPTVSPAPTAELLKKYFAHLNNISAGSQDRANKVVPAQHNAGYLVKQNKNAKNLTS